MKAIGYKNPSETATAGSLQEYTLDMPVASARDLLIEVKAVSVNPVDTKLRGRINPSPDIKVLGYDGVGIVKAVGEQVTLFNVGDRVFYAGDMSRQGSNAEFQLVDERIVGLAPTSISDAQAAALPLTAVTAWELLFDRLQLNRDSNQSVLIIGAAGGVGSIMLQLAKQLTNVTIIATASREKSADWVRKLGADHVINHHQPLAEQLTALGFDSVDNIVSLTNTDQHFEQIVECITPQGKFALIDDPASLNVVALKRKSVSLHWEFMFTRSLFETTDMQTQHDILSQIAQLIDNGTLVTTLGEELGKINVENLVKAHQLLESQTAVGKLVLAGF
ncbi:zinc-type alcohol dehydrogenase-like protein SA1988 [Paraglaciecola mesophila KMM 241]|uniref:Zinc-type alcohol dehydrogenase-like protein n=1 Tax=Paraglaciecola mesophila KMM 241 TaxID=1128912 RepID=K6XUI1_9ALTE|nr:zinc-binding alcohol dehydrogenase family protein [Paraglaciecola mesophila]GAC24274.1 zinc-type alcohol dehydrogenase-like protein SA1988 [Paraglaciecola mesophila KMM 241]